MSKAIISKRICIYIYQASECIIESVFDDFEINDDNCIYIYIYIHKYSLLGERSVQRQREKEIEKGANYKGINNKKKVSSLSFVIVNNLCGNKYY